MNFLSESYQSLLEMRDAWRKHQPSSDVIDAKTFNFVSQAAHVSSAAFLVSACGRWGWKGLLFGSAGMLLWATAKEFWYDYEFESPAVRGSSLLDWSMYVAGTILGVLAGWR